MDPSQQPVAPTPQPSSTPAPLHDETVAPSEPTHSPAEPLMPHDGQIPAAVSELPAAASVEAGPLPLIQTESPPQSQPADTALDHDLAAISASMTTQEENAADGVMSSDPSPQPASPVTQPAAPFTAQSAADPDAAAQGHAVPLVPAVAPKKISRKKLLIPVAGILAVCLGLGGGYAYYASSHNSKATVAVPEQKLATGTVGSLSSKYPKVWVVTDSDSWDFYAQDMSNQDKNNLSYLGIAILPYSASSGYRNFADAKASTIKNYMEAKSITYKPTDILKKDRILNGKDAYYVEFKAPGIKSSDNPQPENLHSKAVLLAYDDNNAMLIEMQVTDTQAVEINEFENIVNAITIKK